MNKEEMAQEWALNQDGSCPACSEATLWKYKVEGYLAGLDAGQAQSAKLLAKKDKEIKEMQNHIEFQSQVMVDMGGVVLENKKLEADLDIAKELIKEMREALEFYGVKCNWKTVDVGYGDRVLISGADREDLSTTDRLVEYGGKLARKTLKENTDKIKALLGEE